MSTEETKASQIRAPNDFKTGVANDFGCRFFTCTGTIARDALPQTWSKRRWVILRNVGSVEAHFAFSKTSTATVNPSPTATAAGASDQVGGRLLPGEVQQRELPYWESGSGELCYFVRITSAGSTSLLAELGDGE